MGLYRTEKERQSSRTVEEKDTQITTYKELEKSVKKSASIDKRN